MTRTPHFEPSFLRVLSGMGGEPFTPTDLIKAYRAIENEHGRNDRTSRQFVDRNITRLVKFGYATQVSGNQEGPKYFRALSSPAATPPSNANQADAPNAIPPARKNTLVEKLHQQRMALLSVMGEAEAYEDISTERPDMHQIIQPLYNEARDKVSKLHGRVKALESLISATQTCRS